MKTWWWLGLLILTGVVGCAQGYSERESIYEGAPSEKFYQNPETPEQQQMRIWSEESHR